MTYDSEEIRIFYNKFTNAMAQIIVQYNGKILKNIGDGPASYFPKTSDYTVDSAIRDVTNHLVASSKLMHEPWNIFAPIIH